MRGCLTFCLWALTLGWAWSAPRQHLDLVDDLRHRKVPVSLYLPGSQKAPFRLIVFSHGLGGTRDAYAELASFWCDQGYAVAAVEHVGSNFAALRSAFRANAVSDEITSPDEVVGRPRDVSFVLDQLGKRGDINVKRVGLAGHSFGAYTAMAGAGIPAIVHGHDAPVQLGDPRVVAAIAMSPQEKGLFFRPEDMKEARVPLMILTGTRDRLRTGAKWEDRAEVFDFLGKGNKFLGVFKGATHLAFAGVGPGSRTLQGPLAKLTLDFWNAYLLSNGRAELTKARAEADTSGLLEIWRSK